MITCCRILKLPTYETTTASKIYKTILSTWAINKLFKRKQYILLSFDLMGLYHDENQFAYITFFLQIVMDCQGKEINL